MNNCPCPTDIIPANPCCPNTIDLGSTIEVRDKDCNPRRLVVNGTGVLAARNNKAGMMDGSAEKPLTMDFESFFAADGYVLLQSPGGRVIAVKPNEDLTAPNAVLQFVYQDGAFKLIPISHDNLFDDATSPSSSQGIMAMIACGGAQGLIKLGKFLPFPQTVTGGPWPVVVNNKNEVLASTKAINEIPATDSVEKLDVLLGAVDGKWKTILPVKDKTIIGVETGGVTKWELKDTTSGVTPVARTVVYSKEHGAPFIPNITEPINVAGLTGYLAEFKFALLHFQYRIATSSANQIVNLAIDGRIYSGVATIAGGFSAESNNNSAIVPIPTAKTWSLTITNTGNTSGGGTGDHHIIVSLDGWIK